MRCSPSIENRSKKNVYMEDIRNTSEAREHLLDVSSDKSVMIQLKLKAWSWNSGKHYQSGERQTIGQTYVESKKKGEVMMRWNSMTKTLRRRGGEEEKWSDLDNDEDELSFTCPR